MKWLSALIMSAALLGAPSAASAAPSKPLPACTPAQTVSGPIVDENTVIEGRTIVVHPSPDGSRRCGDVQVSTTCPQAPKRGRR